MFARLALPLALAVLPASAGAQSLHATLSAGRLSIESPCARQVTLHADAAPGQVVLDATASRQEELDNLSFSGSDPARLRGRARRCAVPDGEEPSLAITLHVPAGFAVSVDDGGAASYDLDGVLGAFALDGSGAMTVKASQIGAMALDLSGSGEVEIGRAEGNGRISLSGSAKVTIGDGGFPALSVESSGSGEIRVARGTIGRIAVSSSGDASVSIGGVVGGGAVELSGSGDVTIAHATGPVTQESSGSGTLVIGDR